MRQPDRQGVNMSQYGVYGEKSFRLGNDWSSVTFGLGYSRINEQGLVEFFPSISENIDQYSSRFGLQTRLGSQLVALNANYDYQHYDAQPLVPYFQDRSIYGARLWIGDPDAFTNSSDVKSNDIKFKDGDTKFQIGASHDVESYGSVQVPKNDYFVGVTKYWFQSFGGFIIPMDITITPAILTATVNDDVTQRNAQYRTTIATDFLLLEGDCARRHNLENLTMSFVARNDFAIQGPVYYENYRLGAHLTGISSEFPFVAGLRTKLLFDVGYDFQYFYNIQKPLNLFDVRVSAQF